jgi:dynein heavy chain
MRNFIKPKPNTPHYSFTNREVWTIIDCLGMSNKGSVYDDTSLCKLWVHETCRVIRDKLAQEDINTFEKLVSENLNKFFQKDMSNIKKDE